MPDTVSRLARSRIMARVKSKDTGPEVAVRRKLHRAGYRFRLHRTDLPGSPDLLLPKYRVALFVNGCFWHWHGCKRSRMPNSNVEYWTSKIERNVNRDRETRINLESMGWRHRVIWECQVDEGVELLLGELAERQGSTSQ